MSWYARLRLAVCAGIGASLLREYRCPACRAVCLRTGPERGSLCPDCLRALPLPPTPHCSLCATPLARCPAPGTVHLCPRCLAQPPPWSHFACITLYTGLARKLLLRHKYGNDWALTPALGRLLAQAVRRLPAGDVLLPIPRHPRRLLWHGVNPIHEIARETARLCGLPLAADCLRRTRQVRPQAELSAEERRTNPEGSFAARNVRHKRVIVLDDVCTTGATMHNAALCLRTAGASAVYVAVIARTPLPSESWPATPA